MYHVHIYKAKLFLQIIYGNETAKTGHSKLFMAMMSQPWALQHLFIIQQLGPLKNRTTAVKLVSQTYGIKYNATKVLVLAIMEQLHFRGNATHSETAISLSWKIANTHKYSNSWLSVYLRSCCIAVCSHQRTLNNSQCWTTFSVDKHKTPFISLREFSLKYQTFTFDFSLLFASPLSSPVTAEG